MANQDRICYVVGAMSLSLSLRPSPAPGDYVIAADRGYDSLMAYGVTPDLVVGDFDSLGYTPQHPNVTRPPAEKDDTDTMLALREGLRRGCDTFYLYGATGGARLDHTLANLQSLAFLLRHRARGYLYDQNFVYTAIENETLALEREVDWGIVSLFSMGDCAEHITLDGLQYPLTDGTIDCGFPLGVSNHIVAPTARITVGRGPLLVGWELPKLAGEE